MLFTGTLVRRQRATLSRALVRNSLLPCGLEARGMPECLEQMRRYVFWTLKPNLQKPGAEQKRKKRKIIGYHVSACKGIKNKSVGHLSHILIMHTCLDSIVLSDLFCLSCAFVSVFTLWGGGICIFLSIFSLFCFFWANIQ